MNRLSLAALALSGVFAALPASAQFAKPEDAIKYRKAAFTVMATHFGRVGAMAAGRVPFDAAAAAANTELVVIMSKLPYTAFGEGTGSGDTRAKPNVWTDAAKFKQLTGDMQEAVVKLNTAAKGGNFDQVKAAFGDAGKSCKACHDEFRKE
jgi:cytochrome c556